MYMYAYTYIYIYIYWDQARASRAHWLTELYYGTILWNYIMIYVYILQDYIEE